MSALNVDAFLNELVGRRNDAYAEAVKTSDHHLWMERRAEWASYALTISSLHVYSDGQFGSPFAEQEAPEHPRTRQGVSS